jgi:hypothetical protein
MEWMGHIRKDLERIGFGMLEVVFWYFFLEGMEKTTKPLG